MREELRQADRLGGARRLVAERVLQDRHAARARLRRGCGERARRRWPSASPAPKAVPAGTHDRRAAVALDPRGAGAREAEPRDQPRLRLAHAPLERHVVAHARRRSMRGSVVGIVRRPGRRGRPRRARRGAEQRVSTAPASSAAISSRPRAASITARSGHAEAHVRQQREPVGRAGEHRRAAEHVADGDRKHRHAAPRAASNSRAERARQRELRGVRFVQPHAAGRERQHDGGRPLVDGARGQRGERRAVVRADGCRAGSARPARRRAPRAPSTRRATGDDPVVVLRSDAEAREVGLAPRGGSSASAPRRRRARRSARAGRARRIAGRRGHESALVV